MFNKFLDNPSQNNIKFIRENNLGFNGITKLLESGSFDKLPPAGTYLSAYDSMLTCGYSINNDGTYIPTNWQILGYDASIPEYVKYKNGNEKVYMHTLSGGLLIDDYSIENSISVYSDKNGENYIGIFEKASTDDFTYGNLCSYSVPNKIMKDGKTYDFCGHNMTIYPELLVRWNNEYQTKFNNTSPNKYSTSIIRNILNDNIYTMMAFKEHITSIINRTWVHTAWRTGSIIDKNGCEHISDKVWLLGRSQVLDSVDQRYPGDPYETSTFANYNGKCGNIFTDNVSRKKFYMVNNQGERSSIEKDWWLRSAHNNSWKDCEGYIMKDGNYNENTVTLFNYGILPVVSIC